MSEDLAFEDLPLVIDYEHIRGVHTDASLYLLNKSRLTAHGSPFDCAEVTPQRAINNPAWRVATNAQVRSLGGGWCTRCS
jgi:hypothetical protein